MSAAADAHRTEPCRSDGCGPPGGACWRLLVAGSVRRLPAADGGATASWPGARVAGDETRTRFVADLTVPVGYTVYVLPDPYRVIIDLPAGRLRPAATDAGRQTRGLVTRVPLRRPSRRAAPASCWTRTGPVLIEKSFMLEAAGRPAGPHRRRSRATTTEAFAGHAGAGRRGHRRRHCRGERRQKRRRTSRSPCPVPSRGSAAAPAGRAEGRGAAETPAASLIVIDPGHGGIDPGAIGLRKTKEKDVVLAFGLALARSSLKATGNIDVVMTRDRRPLPHA